MLNENISEKKVYSIKEFCQAYGICETIGRRWIKSKDFPKIIVGRRILIPREAVERYINTISTHSV